MSSTIAIQGDRASFHDIAAAQFFATDSDRVYADTFASTFRAVEDRQADFGLVAIENTLYGPISEVHDLLLASRFHIFGELHLRIGQCLIGVPAATIDDIKTVYSHPVALAQCEEYLDTELGQANRIEHHDTAASVKLISQMENITVAAIASREAAELHGMSVMVDGIETHKQNYTRFVALSRSIHDIPTDADKTSLVIVTSHKERALYDALGCFATRAINLTSLHSRPIMGDPWHYSFYLDVARGMNDSDFLYAHEELAQLGTTVRILGSYVSAKTV